RDARGASRPRRVHVFDPAVRAEAIRAATGRGRLVVWPRHTPRRRLGWRRDSPRRGPNPKPDRLLAWRLYAPLLQPPPRGGSSLKDKPAWQPAKTPHRLKLRSSVAGQRAGSSFML